MNCPNTKSRFGAKAGFLLTIQELMIHKQKSGAISNGSKRTVTNNNRSQIK
jgi:hypothetical protein